MQLKQGSWTESAKKNIGLGYPTSSWWFRFTLLNQTESTKELYLKLDNPLLDNIKLYSRNNDNSFKTITTGDQFPIDTRDYHSKDFLFKLKASPGNNVFYFRIKTTSSLNFNPKLLSSEEVVKEESRDRSLIYFLAAWLILLALYNIFIFIAVKKIEYILFVILVLSLLMLKLLAFGYLSLYIVPPDFNNILMVFIILLTILSSSLFFKNILIPGRDLLSLTGCLNILLIILLL